MAGKYPHQILEPTKLEKWWVSTCQATLEMLEFSASTDAPPGISGFGMLACDFLAAGLSDRFTGANVQPFELLGEDVRIWLRYTKWCFRWAETTSSRFRGSTMLREAQEGSLPRPHVLWGCLAQSSVVRVCVDNYAAMLCLIGAFLNQVP